MCLQSLSVSLLPFSGFSPGFPMLPVQLRAGFLKLALDHQLFEGVAAVNIDGALGASQGACATSFRSFPEKRSWRTRHSISVRLNLSLFAAALSAVSRARARQAVGERYGEGLF